MFAREANEQVKPRLIDDNALAIYLSMGRNSARNFSEECGAVRYFGKRRLNDTRIIDQSLDAMARTES